MKILNALQTKLDGTSTNHLHIKYNDTSVFLPLRQLSKAQLALFKTLNDADKLNYLLSFLGKINRVKRAKKSENIGREKNHFLNLYRNSCNNTSFKKPLSKLFHFGIEIETLIPCDSVHANESSTMQDCYNCDGSGSVTTYDSNDNDYEHSCSACGGDGQIENDDSDSDSDGVECLASHLKDSMIKGLHVKEDGSLRPDRNDFGAEIAVLTSDFKNLEKLCKELKNLEASVNDSCGLHVHLDVRDKTSEQLDVIKTNFENSLNIMFSMIPKSRQNNSYCVKRVSNEKYSAVNTSTIERLGTIEVRCHSGTTNYTKIKNWCDILKLILDCESVTEKPLNYYAFCKAFKIPKDLKQYMSERRALFSDENESEDN